MKLAWANRKVSFARFTVLVVSAWAVALAGFMAPAYADETNGSSAIAESMQKAIERINSGEAIDINEVNVALEQAKEAISSARSAVKDEGKDVASDVTEDLKKALERADAAIKEMEADKDKLSDDGKKALEALKAAIATARMTLNTGMVDDAVINAIVSGLDQLTEAVDSFKKTVNSHVATAPTAATDLVYNGKEQVGVASGTGYTVSGSIAVNAGAHTATATLAEGFFWANGTVDPIKVTYSIAKAPQTIKAQKSAFKVKAKQVAKKAKKLAVSFSAEGGKCTWSKAKSTAKGGKAGKATPAKISIAKNGNITVKKGAKKGTYLLKVKATAPTTANYTPASATIQLTVKVK